MFEDILGEKRETKKKKRQINLMPKGQTINAKNTMKRANSIRRQIKKVKDKPARDVLGKGVY
jgi:hypothetical protein